MYTYIIDKLYYIGTVPQTIKEDKTDINHRYITHPDDHIFYRYQVIHKLGSGAYSDVIKCIDHKHNCEVAVKISKNSKKYKESLLNEVNIMAKLLFNISSYKCVSSTTSLLVTRILKQFNWRTHPIIVMEMYSKNLYNSKLKDLTYNDGKVIIIDILEALNYLKSQDIVHCDLKPENIFFINNTSYNVVVGDYGMSQLDTQKSSILYYYIQTRWYRSPEIILHIPYSYSIDMWSVGAIAIELFTNTPIFKSNNESELLYIMEHIVGEVLAEKVLAINDIRCNKKNVNNIIDEYIDYKYSVSSNYKLNDHILTIKQQLRQFPHGIITEFIKQIFIWNPDERITPEKALRLFIDSEL